MDLGLSGMKTLITGGTKGIGRAVAEHFAAEGADVAICARDAAGVTQAVATLASRGVRATGRALDVSDGPALTGWVTDAANELGGLDIVVSNVSALAIGQDEASWQAEFATDMMGTVRTVNAAMPFLEQSKAASIVVIASVSGPGSGFRGGPLRRVQGGAYSLREGIVVSTRRTRHQGQRAVAGEYVLPWRSLGED